MDVPAKILELLKCYKCNGYLSRGPVYLQPDGTALCGLCFTPEGPAIRNIQYEALAQCASYPCKYNKLGCGETVTFSQEGETTPHEDICEYRKWLCPVLSSTHCDWLGPRANLLQHCQDQHPDLVLQNPSILKHDILKSNETTYIFRWLQLLFLLHVKLNVTTGKLYHLVRFLGPSDEAKDYIYVVNIKNNEKRLSKKKGDVEPQGCLAIQEAASLSIDINKLCSIPGGYTGVTFTIEVLRKASEACDAREVSTDNLCIGCGPQLTVMVYRDKRGWRCERCAPVRRTCMFCKYQDIDDKCGKHATYFCQKLNQCGVCYKTIERGSLTEHRSTACEPICRVGSTWRPIRGLGRQCLVSGAAGTALCEYFLTEIGFILNVYIPVTSERLREFSCVVEVTQPCTGEVRMYKPEAVYDKWCDWHIEIKKEEFVTWDCVLDVSVDVRSI